MEQPIISSSSNIPGVSPIPPSKPTYDWNVRTCSIELLVTLVLVNVGMGPLEQSMKDIVNQQNIQNKVDADMIQLSNLISEIETASKAGGADVKSLQGQLQAVLKNLFGPNASTETTVDGQTYIVPDSGSDLDKFIAALKQKNAKDPNYDYHKDPVFDLLSQVGTYLFGTTVSGSWQTNSGSNTWNENFTCPNNMWKTIMDGSSSDFQNMINAMAGNHWLTQNPGQKDDQSKSVPVGTDYLSTIYNQTSGAQSGLQGMGSQNTALIQTDSASENSLDQSGQHILDSANSLKLYMIQKAAAAA
jgi:hypothetical protein